MIEFLNTVATDHPTTWHLSKILILLISCSVLYYIANIILHKVVAKLIQKSPTDIDDLIISSPVYPKLAMLPPMVLLYQFAYIFMDFEDLVTRVVFALIAMLIIMTINSALGVIEQISFKRQNMVRANVKSYVQISKIITWIIGVIVMISILLGKSPLVLLSGIGALTAVLLLVFRDTILSFVAGMQLSSYDLLRVGDWIEAPKFGADGDVIDITLHTVMIQNWDKTITVIPTYKLVEDSFRNWRGMSQSGGRRIKRAIYLDMSTVKFCDNSMLERFEKYQLITEYVRSKRNEIQAHNTSKNIDTSELINGRQMTNIGTFRRYLENYLKKHPFIQQEMTLMVRQLSPTPDGIPIEIYCFTNDIRWTAYENIQSDIFDHILSVVPMFELRIFQHPTGSDFTKLKN